MTEHMELKAAGGRLVPVSHHVAMRWFTAHENPVSLRVDAIPIWIIDIQVY
jgi:hypothetical protein